MFSFYYLQCTTNFQYLQKWAFVTMYFYWGYYQRIFFSAPVHPQLSAILVYLCLRWASLSMLLSLPRTRLMFLVLNARFISLWQALCIFTSWGEISSSSSPKLCFISVIVLGKEFPVFPFGVADPCLLLVQNPDHFPRRESVCSVIFSKSNWSLPLSWGWGSFLSLYQK